MTQITLKEIIDYNKEMVLFDSGGFRAGVMDDMFTRKDKNIVRCLWWFFKTHYNDIRTKIFYNQITTDEDYWMSINFQNVDKCSEWLKENDIEYISLWYNSLDLNHAYIFKHKEDAMAFKLWWL